MPDDYSVIPDSTRLDTAPDGHPVPAVGIFDAPAHVLIVNRDWVSLMLGAIDRLAYTDVWKDTDDQLYAFRQVLEAEVMLAMPANYLIPVDTFSIADIDNNLSAGNPFGEVFTVPSGQRYFLQSLTIGANSPTMTQIRVQVTGGFPQWDIVRELSPTHGEVMLVNPNVWLNPAWSLRWQIINAAAGDDVFLTASGLVFDV